jgi:hypothetical protein
MTRTVCSAGFALARARDEVLGLNSAAAFRGTGPGWLTWQA